MTIKLTLFALAYCAYILVMLPVVAVTIVVIMGFEIWMRWRG